MPEPGARSKVSVKVVVFMGVLGSDRMIAEYNS